MIASIRDSIIIVKFGTNDAVKNDEDDFSAWVIEKFFAVPGKHTSAGKVKIDI